MASKDGRYLHDLAGASWPRPPHVLDLTHHDPMDLAHLLREHPQRLRAHSLVTRDNEGNNKGSF
jgi:hypothetical protein